MNSVVACEFLNYFLPTYDRSKAYAVIYPRTNTIRKVFFQRKIYQMLYRFFK